jgi:perosamine synthetase
MPTIASPASTATLALHGGTPVTATKIQVVSITIAEDDIAAAVAVMRSGMLAQGPKVLELEKQFGAISDATHAVACANGTCALQMAYQPMIEPGDEVLCPAWSYYATASMICAVGATPVWVDADPETYCIDVADAASKVTKRTTAIAATHLYGNPCDIDAIERLAAEKALSVVYDAAQSHLATYRGKGIGAFGDAVTYSFYPTKNMTTGEGGMVTTNDADLDARFRALRSHGESAKYVHASIGYNFRMTDVEAAMGLSQLSRLPALTAKRQHNAAALTRLLADCPGVFTPRTTEHSTHAFHQYALRLDPKRLVAPADQPLREAFTAALNAEGIATALHYPRPLTRQPVFDVAGVAHQPVADHLGQTVFCIPVHHNLTDDHLRLIAEAVHKVAAAFRG